MKRTVIVCATICTTMLTGGIAQAQPQIVIPPRIAVAEAETASIVRGAQLRAEANATYLTRSEYRRLAGAQALIRARADAELAAYEQFKFEQQLALAEAAAPKTYIINGAPPSAESLETPTRISTARPASLRRTTYIPRSYGDLRDRTTVPRYFSRAYPNRFYRKMVQERGADRLIEHLQRQDEINSRQRQFISTSNGYIDVTGYRRGDMARDPYTGETFRVP